MLWKPVFGHGGGGAINPGGTTLTIKDPSGKVIYTNSHPVRGTEGSKWVVPGADQLPPGSTAQIDNEPASTLTDPSKRLQFDASKGGNPTAVGGAGSNNAAGGPGTLPGFSNPGSGPGVPGGLGASIIGDYGAAPGYIGNKFPKPDLITSAPYNYVNPITFGAAFDKTQNRLLANNAKSAGDFAQGAISNELKALTSYVPASAALQRSTVGADNPFNQGQRTSQIQSTIPQVTSALNKQLGDFQTYASGKVPNSVVDSALTTSDRSQAADIAATSGFGVNSSAARGVSDLLSAKDRIGLSQYGEAGISANTKQQSDLLLAPTEYANAGSQVKIMPALSASQLQQQNFNDINAFSLINPNTALGSATSQNQFVTSQQQSTNVFNANNTNNFALSFFNYLNSYVNSVANAAQTNINTGVGVTQQANAAAAATAAQNAAATNSAITAGGAAVGGIASGIANAGGSTPSSTTPTNNTPGVNFNPQDPNTDPNLNVPDFTYGSTSNGTDQASYQRYLTMIQQAESINTQVQ